MKGEPQSCQSCEALPYLYLVSEEMDSEIEKLNLSDSPRKASESTFTPNLPICWTVAENLILSLREPWVKEINSIFWKTSC